MKFKNLCLLFVLLLTSTIFAQEFKTPEELANENGAFADIDGVSIYYETQGDPQNPAVVLIHGFGGSTFTWRDLMPALQDAGYYAIAVDLPPFGLSDKNPDIDYSRSAMADYVSGLMDELSISSATIVGHSMGGAVTAQFAVRHPEKVSKLIFVAGGIFEAIAPDEQAESESSSALSIINSLDPKSPAAPLLLRTLITRDFFVNTIKSAYYDDSIVTDEVADGYAQLLLIEDAPIGFLAYMQAQEQNPITLDDLVQADTVPTLLIWGQEDTWVTPKLGEAMYQELSNAELILYPNVGHIPMEENWEQFNADIINFLNQ